MNVFSYFPGEHSVPLNFHASCFSSLASCLPACLLSVGSCRMFGFVWTVVVTLSGPREGTNKSKALNTIEQGTQINIYRGYGSTHTHMHKWAVLTNITVLKKDTNNKTACFNQNHLPTSSHPSPSQFLVVTVWQPAQLIRSFDMKQ